MANILYDYVHKIILKYSTIVKLKANRFQLRIRIRIRGVNKLASACTSVFADVEKLASVPSLNINLVILFELVLTQNNKSTN